MIFQSWYDVSQYVSARGDRPYPQGSPRSTRVIKHDDSTVAIKYHYTDVVTYKPYGMVLCTNNWRTVTTKKRINDSLPNSVRVYQEKWRWFIWINGVTLEFEEGMTLDYDGKLTYPESCSVCDLPDRFVFVSDIQDVAPIKADLGYDKVIDFDSFFVYDKDGDHVAIYGMSGVIPDSHKSVTRVL